MKPIDKLTKDYKLATRKGIKKVRAQKTAELIGTWIGILIGVGLLSLASGSIAVWTVGIDFPYFLDLLVTFLVLFSVGPKYRPAVISAVWVVFAILLLFWYAGVTPLNLYFF